MRPVFETLIRRRLLTLAMCVSVLSACERGAPDDILTGGKKLYSQFNEELIIRHFFDDRRGGFFVDVGSYHWKIDSTTYFLEKHLGWTGIGIDALPQVREGYLEHRPNTSFFNYIVTDHSGTTEELYLGYGVSSTDKDHHNTFFSQENFDPRAIRVPTITLNELLDANDVARIDFLSMDIELSEPVALAGFDIERFRPKLVCIEVHPKVRARIAAYFDRNAYERIDEYLNYDKINWYYRPRL